ncbi:MAG: hypothetical protein ABWZ88_08000, partial [Variovorax sp.]
MPIFAVFALAGCGGGGGGSSGFGGLAAVGTADTAAAPAAATTTTAASTSNAASSGNQAVVNATDPAIPNNVLTSGGTFDANAYRATAAMMGKDGGIAYRYGPSPAEYGNAKLDNLPTWGQRQDNAFVSDQQGGQRPCLPGNCGTWQVGNWSNSAGGYSSNIGHVAYIPDSPGQRIGVSDLAISSVSNAVFSQKPELSWTFYGGGLDEINALAYKAAGGDASNPVAVGRCYGRPGWCMNSVMVFQGG